MKDTKIDIVIAWVDGNDKKWQKEKQKYDGSLNRKEDARVSRYRDWDNLQYLFRGIEKFAPWVNKVHLVTAGQIPSWLNTAHPKLNVVFHEDFIPQKYLPTFSSHPIELNFHRIQGLSERFIYFNDDMFLIKKTRAKDFFCGDTPCDSAVLNAICSDRIPGEKKLFLMPIMNMSIINSYFSKRTTLRQCPFKWFNIKYGTNVFRTIALSPWNHFTGFVNWHLPYALKKSTMKEVWRYEHSRLDEVCSHKFRNDDDVNIWLFTYWQYAKNDFKPRNPKIGREFGLTDNEKQNKKICKKIVKSHYKMICLNDAIKEEDAFEKSRKMVKEHLNKILPDKCKYEL